MKRGCRKYGLDERKNDSLHQPYAWEYLIAKHDGVNLVWCNIFKSASSRLITFILIAHICNTWYLILNITFDSL